MPRYKKPKAKWSVPKGTYIEEEESERQAEPSDSARERRKAAERRLKEMQEAMTKPDTESDEKRARRAAIKKAGYTKYK